VPSQFQLLKKSTAHELQECVSRYRSTQDVSKQIRRDTRAGVDISQQWQGIVFLGGVQQVLFGQVEVLPGGLQVGVSVEGAHVFQRHAVDDTPRAEGASECVLPHAVLPSKLAVRVRFPNHPALCRQQQIPFPLLLVRPALVHGSDESIYHQRVELLPLLSLQFG